MTESLDDPLEFIWFPCVAQRSLFQKLQPSTFPLSFELVSNAGVNKDGRWGSASGAPAIPTERNDAPSSLIFSLANFSLLWLAPTMKAGFMFLYFVQKVCTSQNILTHNEACSVATIVSPHFCPVNPIFAKAENYRWPPKAPV